jgi:DNA-binding winged helix-turn-helix (wHTH) protein/Tfp pilus assembly protein PilF
MRAPERYQFGGFTLDALERRLMRGDTPLPLAPKAFDLLLALVRRAGRLVTKQDLLDIVWSETSVEEGILAVHVSAVRKTLGGSRDARACIETVPLFGYRFTAPVQRLTENAAAPPDARHRPDSEVLALVGRGRLHLVSASMFELPKARDAFQAAIDRDPTYAEAHAGLALTWCAHAELRMTPRDEAYGHAKASALRALAVDETCADALVALGSVLFVSEWDWAASRRSVERALVLDPHHTDALLLYGRILESAGELDRGLAMKEKALEREPLSPLVVLQIAVGYWHQRRYDDSIEWANRALALDPNLLAAREHLAGAYWKRGEFDRMMQESLRQAEAYGAATGTLAEVRRLCELFNRTFAAGGRAAVVQLSREQAARNPAPAAAVQRAVLAAEAGDLDDALDNLDRAIEGRDPCLVHLAVAPQWDPLRGDPRFVARLKRMGLPESLG